MSDDRRREIDQMMGTLELWSARIAFGLVLLMFLAQVLSDFNK